MGGLNKSLAKIPFLLFAGLYCAWLGYDFYDWQNSVASELGLKRAQVAQAKQDLEGLKKKLTEGEEFYKNLDLLRARIRQLLAQLDSTKSVLKADIDIAELVRMFQLEAKRLNLSIKGIRPEQELKKDYYTEVPYTVSLRGAYVQMLVFFDRVARLQRVIRIADFSMKPTGNNRTKFVELEANVKMVSYKYQGTAVDEVAEKDTMRDSSSPPSQTAPGSNPAPGAPATNVSKPGGSQ